MTVKELIEKLKDAKPDSNVWVLYEAGVDTIESVKIGIECPFPVEDDSVILDCREGAL